MDFMLLDPVLWTNIQNQLDEDFGIGTTKDLVGNLVPASLESEKGMMIYLIPMDWIEIIDQGFESYELHSLGLLLGEITGGKFSLSLSILSRIAPLTNSKIIISERAAGSFTYGRSILKESVLEASKDLKRGQMVVVLNENHDSIGLAVLTTDGYRVDRMKSDDLVAKNLADIGFYIRKLY